MNKLLYFTIYREDSDTYGINQKIRNQVRAFCNMDIQSYLCVSSNDKVKLYKCKMGDLIEEDSCELSQAAVYNKNLNSIKRRLSSTKRLNECLVWFDKQVQRIKPQYIYIRRILPIMHSLSHYIKLWSKQNIKVIWEIPTWNSYAKTPYWMLLHLQEEFSYIFLSKYFYKIVAISSKEEKTNKKITFINNGVYLPSIPKKRSHQNKDLNLVCLATFDYWHGYDRLINGFADYIEKKGNVLNINLHMVGNGNITELVELSKKRKVSNYVHFVGLLTGEKLNNYLDNMDVAIGNLGFFRQGVYSDTSIKIREYCARGLPFITALDVNDFPDDFPYILHVPMDESYIDIQSIVDWYNSIDTQKAITDMRKYAEDNLSWEKQLAKILN